MLLCEYMWIYMQVISLEIDRDKPIHFNRLEIMDDKTPQYLRAVWCYSPHDQCLIKEAQSQADLCFAL